MRTSAFFLLIFLLIVTACKKDQTKPQLQLPPITTEGLNTFGCKVNETIIVPEASSGFLMIISGIISDMEMNDSCPALRVEIYNATSKNIIGFRLMLKDLLNVKEINFEPHSFEDNCHNAAYYYPNLKDEDYQGNNPGYFTFDSLSGKATILRIDTTNHIISGTFYFKVKDYKGNMADVKDGRFDLKYPLY